MSTDRDRSPRGDGIQKGFINIGDLSAIKVGWIRGKLSAVKTKDYTSGAGKLMFGTLSDNSASIKIVVFNNDIERFENLFKEDAWLRLNGYTFAEGMYGKEIKVSRTTSMFLSQPFEIKLEIITWTNCEIAKTKGHGDELNILGCIYEVLALKEFVSLTGKNIVKRNVVIIDQTEIKVELVYWGEDALNFCGVIGDSMAVKKARVNVFRDEKTFNVPSSGYSLNFAASEAVEVKKWFSNQNFN